VPGGLAERERALERLGLARGNVVQTVQQRGEQLRQPRERDVGLALHTARSQDPHPGRLGLRDEVLEQGRLPDPGLADQQQRARAPFPGLVEQALHPRSLSCPATSIRAGV
jgi:hypothetical protein